MNEQPTRPDREYQEPGKILLRWKVSAFLPIRPDFEPLQILEEPLYARDFPSEAAALAYWSAPERLVDIRWIQTRRNREESFLQGSEDLSFGRCLELEYQLYRVVSTLGTWCGICGKNIEKLLDGSQRMRSLLQTLEEDMEFLQMCAARRTREARLSFSADELTQLYRSAELFSQADISDSRTKELKAAAKRFLQRTRRLFGGEPFSHLSLLTFTPGELRPVFESAANFSEKAVDFLRNPLWREQQTPILKLRNLAERIQKILPEWNPAEADEHSEVYHRSLWTGLQAAADNICEVINGGAAEPVPASVEILLQRVNEIITRLNLRTHDNSKSWNAYVRDHGRCIALLDTRSGTQIMAFSGYLDCEDVQVQKAFPGSGSLEMLNGFQQISKNLGAVLASFSSDVVDRILRCELNPTVQLTARGPLRTELSTASGEQQLAFLRKSYACCERKILAKSESLGRTNRLGPSVLHVKFEPCLSCYGVIQRWMKLYGISLALDYPKSPL